ncbi:cytochrome b5-related protein-like [Ctenocephalides felis]|uniref:cytochrome b5-related protein-like n=1 Tax=Ctenocephalides felis TaxID=7515 RepID=UPI000E6E1420|nr:cytochrome b5-related protein-like [Ctenocephalides felis]
MGKGKYDIHTHYPSLRDKHPRTADNWLEGQRLDGGAEGLWRIHDKLYDLSRFVENHPGGKEWLEYTKGMDITAAFEAHHISKTAEKLLPKYFVREARTPSHSLLTFHEDGFYKTLKQRMSEEIKRVPKSVRRKSKLIIDFLILGTFISSILSTFYWPLVFLSGLFLAWTSVAAHNFFHQKNNWRMYAFNLTLLSCREWRISHVLSHHLHPNTLVDMECSTAEPFLCWQPKDKGFMKYVSCVISPLFYAIIYIGQYIFRINAAIKRGHLLTPFWHELIPYTLPLAMIIMSNLPIISTLKTWFTIIMIASFFFGAIGYNAAHHHPEIYHHNDAHRKDLDFGKFQLDAVMDRDEVTGSLFMVLTSFGDHGLHHLFPTLDHALLPYLYPAFEEVCEVFGIHLRFTSQWELVKGQFRQLLRTLPNLIPPDVVKK